MTDLIEQYRQMHAGGHFAGMTVCNFADDIGAVIADHAPVRRILDYGCGKAAAYSGAKIHKLWGEDIEVRCYDPGVPEFSQKPAGLFDGVICCDVLEHIPEEDLDDFIKIVFSHARKFAYVTVCPRAANKTLPDGRNCHLTLKPLEWWSKKVQSLARADLDWILRENP